MAQKVKNLPTMPGSGLGPWVGKIPWRRKWQPLPAWKNCMDRGAWQATVHGVTKSQTRLRTSTFTFHNGGISRLTGKDKLYHFVLNEEHAHVCVFDSSLCFSLLRHSPFFLLLSQSCLTISPFPQVSVSLSLCLCLWSLPFFWLEAAFPVHKSKSPLSPAWMST